AWDFLARLSVSLASVFSRLTRSSSLRCAAYSMSKPSAWRSEIARSATILCMSTRNAAWAAAPASIKAVLGFDTGAVALVIACFSALTADNAPPISAPNLICTSATCHLKCKRGAQRPRKKPLIGGVLLQFDRGKLGRLGRGLRLLGPPPLEEMGVGEGDAAAIGHAVGA